MGLSFFLRFGKGSCILVAMDISVVMPVYNKPKGLVESALRSLKNQTVQPKEVIVVFDGADQEMEFDFKNDWLKTKTIEHGGACKARNEGYKETSGDYLFFMDADVLLRKDCFEKLSEAIGENAFAYCDFDCCGSWVHQHRGCPFSVEAFTERNRASTMSLVARKYLPEVPFDEELQRLQDWDLWIRVIENDGVGIYVPEKLFVAYFQKGDISRQGHISHTDAEKMVRRKHDMLRYKGHHFVDIIIPTACNAHGIKECIESVKETVDLSVHRLIVVANGADYEIEEEEGVYVLRHPDKIGYVKAVNMGLSFATADVVVLLNDDAVVSGDWLNQLLEPLAFPQFEISAPMSASEQNWTGRVPEGDGWIEVHSMVPFFCVAITRKLFVRYGYLSEKFGMGYGDDDEFCNRVRKLGHRIALVRDCVIDHIGGQSFKTLFSNEEIDQMKETGRKLAYT